MSVTRDLLETARVSPEIFELRPDYRALLLVVEGIPPGPSDSMSESMLAAAEVSIREQLSGTPITQLPHILAWREAYKAFGAKPQKIRSSLEALTRRAEGGLPRVNRLTDIYNAISVKYQIPLGGEDLGKYDGAPFLVLATGGEEFRHFQAARPKSITPRQASLYGVTTLASPAVDGTGDRVRGPPWMMRLAVSSSSWMHCSQFRTGSWYRLQRSSPRR